MLQLASRTTWLLASLEVHYNSGGLRMDADYVCFGDLWQRELQNTVLQRRSHFVRFDVNRQINDPHDLVAAPLRINCPALLFLFGFTFAGDR